MDGSAGIPPVTPVRVVVIGMDAHLAGAVAQARRTLRRQIPGLTLTAHAANLWESDADAAADAIADIEKADIIVAGMLFLEGQIKPILPALKKRAASCDAFVGALSAPEIVKLTRLGRFRMDKPQSGPLALLKKLRGSSDKAKNGAQQAKMLRQLPKILKYIPGAAQDVRVYFLMLQYWLAGSEDNVRNMIAQLIDRYAGGPRAALIGTLDPADPVEYPETGVYHPRMKPPIGVAASKLPLARSKRPAVGVLILRSYALSKDAGHYDGVIEALEARGLRVIPAFASGLDAREAIEKYFVKGGRAIVDAVVSLSGFSLVGGPAYNDAKAAADILERLNVPYLTGQALEFQSLSQWGSDSRGLTPIESTMMVAIPEIDGAANPIVFGGRAGPEATQCGGCHRGCEFEAANEEKRILPCPERAEMLAARVEKLISLRTTPRASRKLAIVLFNFPPNSGAVGTAAYLAVFESLFNTLKALKRNGYSIDLPATSDALRDRILNGNAERYGADANVHASVPADVHIRRERKLGDIEAQWGPAPGRHNTDGRSIFIHGEQFGEVFVGVQPSFGYEGDPMRLLFEKGFAPTHAFAAFYRYLREDFSASAVLHFGTHGALEFMPGKHTGLSGDCWPDYLIGDLPNFYFYAANNPSEAAIAKRRSAAVTISYLTPPVTKAELYKELSELRATLTRWRATDPADATARRNLFSVAAAQAKALELECAETLNEASMDTLRAELDDLEETLIPFGLHVAGEAPNREERIDLLAATIVDGEPPSRATLEAIVDGASAKEAARRMRDKTEIEILERLAETNRLLSRNDELDAIVSALDGNFVRPAPGGDLIRNPEILPTGRNIHGFDPFRLPSAFAVADGAAQAKRLLDRHIEASGSLPETIAMVLWGTDNLKSEGGPIAQALALMGARPHVDGYGRVCGADLIPLEDVGRPRIDVMATLSGIFRDLLPMQTRMLADAAYKAAAADEPTDRNFIRKHALAYQAEHGCDLETAALRVFSNADGAYGANVNQLIDSGAWETEDDLADAYAARKSFAFGRGGSAAQQGALLNSILQDVDLAYQNLESVELGVTTVDHYFDTLGGIGRAVKRAKGEDTAVYIGDQTRGDGIVRTLSEQVHLETRTRSLNPKWYEGMLRHGYEGVRQIEAHVTNTMGWSATTGQVDPWVYQQITETFVLDTELHNRLADLNPKSCAKVANRLLEASDRQYWTPDNETLEALRRASEDLEDRIEGLTPASAVA